MTIKVGINGFGRIGRLVFRSIIESKSSDIEVVAINDFGASSDMALLLKYDSAHGICPAEVGSGDGYLEINGKKIKYVSEANPENLPWDEKNVDIVFECTGKFTNHEAASRHLKGGAKRVLVSAPCTGADLTVVYGVNHQKLLSSHVVVSNASCTTNCLTPVASVLYDVCGIAKGFMTTIHSYTGDQRLVDSQHSDPRRARAGAVNIIPTSTGAAKAVGLVMPELKGLLDGTSLRVPTQNVSLIDLTFFSKHDTTVEEINSSMQKAADGKLKGVLEINKMPLVSLDFNHNPASSIFDATQTQVVDGNFVRVLSWYDNEWGFSNRMLDTARAMFAKI